MTTFGLTIPQRGAFIGLGTMGELLEYGPLAEETGLFDSVWVGDSITAKPRPEAITLLGALAGSTDTLKLAVGCMASFPIRDPAVFAYQWATLDMVSNGRALLAACTGIVAADGASRKEGSHFGGIPDVERPKRMEETIELCRLLWTGEEVSFEGTYHQYESLRIQPATVQDPCPIWIAANPAPGKYWDRSMRRVARLADGVQTCALAPGYVALLASSERPLLAEFGKDEEAFPISAYHNVNIGDDIAACREESQRFLDAYYGPTFTPEQVESWVSAGTPDQVITHLQDIIDQGATHITIRLTSFDQETQFKRLTSEILPALV